MGEQSLRCFGPIVWNVMLPEDLIVLSSGRIPDDAVKKDLPNAHNVGIEGFQEFVTERITSSNTSFYDKIT